MSDRNYSTQPSMFDDHFTKKVVRPDAGLVGVLHTLLDMLNEDQAMAIDFIVADLLKFRRPSVEQLQHSIDRSLDVMAAEALVKLADLRDKGLVPPA